MVKFLNILAFIGSVCKAFAKGGREVLPEWEQLKKDNERGVLSKDKEVDNVK